MESRPPSPGHQRVWQHVLRVPRDERRLLARLRLLGWDPRPSDTVDGAYVVESVGERALEELHAVVERYAPRTDIASVPSLPGRLEGPATAPLDFDEDDDPDPCPWCSQWRAQRCIDHRGEPVLREWHHPRCPTVLAWDDEPRG